MMNVVGVFAKIVGAISFSKKKFFNVMLTITKHF